MENRRSFLNKLGGLAIGTSLINLGTMRSVSASEIKVPEKLDEKFWGQVRASFPLDKDLSFMNNGTMGIVPNRSLEKMEASLYHTNHKAKYGGGKKQLIKSIEAFVQADSGEIGLTHNVTEGNNILCWGLPLKKGDEVLISDQEHVGNALAWLNRAKVDGISVKPIGILCSPEEIVERFKKAIGPKTKAITIPHIPCTTGQINPIKEICSMAKEKGIYTVVDGAHGPGMLELNVKDLGCDAYVSCGHKWMLGPAGTGFIYVKKEMMDVFQVKFIGAYGDTGWDINTGIKGYVDTAHRYHYGTQSAALYDGWNESIKFLNEIGMARVESRCKDLANRVYNGVKDKKDIQILSQENGDYRGGIVGFRFPNKDNLAFFTKMRDKGIMVRYVAESNLDSIRVSCHIYNSIAETDQIVKEVLDY